MSDKAETPEPTRETSRSSPERCPQCGSLIPAAEPDLSQTAESSQVTSGSDSAEGNKNVSSESKQGTDGSGSTEGTHKNGDSEIEGLSKQEWDTFRDILNNANNTLRFQVQLGVPLLAGSITALNIIPPQSHQELLNLLDRWVFIPVLLSMAIAFYGLELHWKGKNSVQVLTKLITKKYHLVHLTIFLQATGLILLMVFVLLEYK